MSKDTARINLSGFMKRRVNLGCLTIPMWLVFASCLILLVLTGVNERIERMPTATPDEGTPTATLGVTSTPEPTETLIVVTDTPEPTRDFADSPSQRRATSVPPTPDTSDCRLGASFQADVTVPDNTVIDREQSFDKVWRIRNTGTCDWTHGYGLTYVDGDRMSGPDSVLIPYTLAGETVEVSVPLAAPEEPGQYRGYWQVCTSGGECFGERVYVQIISPTATPNTAATQRAQDRINATATVEAYARQPPQGIWCNQNAATRGVCVGNFRYVRSIGYTSAPSNGRFVAFEVAVKNIGLGSISMNPNDLTLVMQDGSSYSYSAETFAYWARPMQHVSIAPGDNAQGGIVFLVPSDTGVGRVIYRGGLFESDITIDLKRPPDQP